MEEMKKEDIDYPHFHIDNKNNIYEESPIKKIKEELSDSDHGNDARFVTSQEKIIDGSNELVSKEFPVKEDLGEISSKEEISEEFLQAETSSYPTTNGLCTKSETTLQSTPSYLLEQDSSQEKELKLRSSSNPKDVLQLGGISSPPRTLTL